MDANVDHDSGMWGARREDAVARATCITKALGEPVALRDLSLAGFVIESSVPLPVGSVHACDLRVNGRSVQASARVIERRYKPTSPLHQIVFAFRPLTARDQGVIQQLAGGLLGFSSGASQLRIVRRHERTAPTTAECRSVGEGREPRF
jgi:hypothetical protein